MVGRRSFSFREKAYFQVQAVSFREGQYYLFPPHDPKSTTRTSLHVRKQVAVVQSSPVGISTWTLWDFSHSKLRRFWIVFVKGGLKMGRNNVFGQFFWAIWRCWIFLWTYDIPGSYVMLVYLQGTSTTTWPGDGFNDFVNFDSYFWWKNPS